jgi:hypothetical protein
LWHSSALLLPGTAAAHEHLHQIPDALRVRWRNSHCAHNEENESFHGKHPEVDVPGTMNG